MTKGRKKLGIEFSASWSNITRDINEFSEDSTELENYFTQYFSKISKLDPSRAEIAKRGFSQPVMLLLKLSSLKNAVQIDDVNRLPIDHLIPIWKETQIKNTEDGEYTWLEFLIKNVLKNGKTQDMANLATTFSRMEDKGETIKGFFKKLKVTKHKKSKNIALHYLLSEGSIEHLTALANALSKINDNGVVVGEFFNELKKVNSLAKVVQKSDTRVISNLANAFSKINDEGKVVAEFYQELRKEADRGGRLGKVSSLKYLAQEGNAQNIANLANALSKIKINDECKGMALEEFCQELRKEADRGGRLGKMNGLKYVAQKGEVRHIAMLANALAKINDDGEVLREFFRELFKSGVFPEWLNKSDLTGKIIMLNAVILAGKETVLQSVNYGLIKAIAGSNIQNNKELLKETKLSYNLSLAYLETVLKIKTNLNLLPTEYLWSKLKTSSLEYNFKKSIGSKASFLDREKEISFKLDGMSTVIHQVDSCIKINGQKYLVEIDGPSHYRGAELNYATKVRNELILNNKEKEFEFCALNRVEVEDLKKNIQNPEFNLAEFLERRIVGPKTSAKDLAGNKPVAKEKEKQESKTSSSSKSSSSSSSDSDSDSSSEKKPLATKSLANKRSAEEKVLSEEREAKKPKSDPELSPEPSQTYALSQSGIEKIQSHIDPAKFNLQQFLSSRIVEKRPIEEENQHEPEAKRARILQEKEPKSEVTKPKSEQIGKKSDQSRSEH